MPRDVRSVVAEVDAYSSLDDLKRLDDLAAEYFSIHRALEHLDVWFRLYERFPEDNGHDCGIFWSVLHGVEAQAGYEPLVLASLDRYPSDFPLLMVNRMLNGGMTAVAGRDLVAVLQSTAGNETCLPTVRRRAELFLETQRRAGRTGSSTRD